MSDSEKGERLYSDLNEAVASAWRKALFDKNGKPLPAPNLTELVNELKKFKPEESE